MPIKGDQRTAFNDALKKVSKTNRELVELYQVALDDITTAIATLQMQIEKGLFADSQALKTKRLNKLYDEISDQLNKLYLAQGQIITSGWTENYVDAYYQVGFAIEKEINNVTLPAQGATYSYSLNYPQINPAFARSELNTLVGGLTFKERQGIDRALMQAKIRDIINNATMGGLTPAQVAKEIKKLDDVYASSRFRAITTARTELLRAYSIATEESTLIAMDRGVGGDKVWDATLDGRTRPAHGRADGQKADENGFFTVGGEKTLMPRGMGLSPGNSINCRCRSVYIPTGVKPNTRGFRSADGDWKTTRGDMTYTEWSKTLEGQASIEKTKIDRRDRAKRLAKQRKKLA